MTLIGSGAVTRRGPVRLCGELYQVAGGDLTHPYDAGAYLLHGDRCVLLDCGSHEGHSAVLANPKYCAAGANASGASAVPSEPPVMWSAMANPWRWPLTR